MYAVEEGTPITLKVAYKVNDDMKTKYKMTYRDVPAPFHKPAEPSALQTCLTAS